MDDDFSNSKYGTKRADLFTAANDGNIWIADLTSSSVIETIALGYYPRLCLFLYVPQTLCRERMLHRGDKAATIESRIASFMTEIEAGVLLATVAPATAFIDASKNLSTVQSQVLRAMKRILNGPP